MGDERLFTWFLLSSWAAAFVFAWVLARTRVSWSKRKVVLLAALPLPGLAAFACLALIGHAIWTEIVTPELCGVDACAMGMMAGTILFLWSVGIYVFAAVAAMLAVRLSR